MLENIWQFDGFEFKTLHPWQNGRRNFVQFCRCEDKNHIFRRLFQRLQQGIKGPCREHVDLIDNVDFVLG